MDDYSTYPSGNQTLQLIGASLSASYSTRGTSWTFGGQVGCNVQEGIWVASLEADFNGTRLNESTTVTLTPPPQLSVPFTQAVTKNLDRYATLRGRVGIAVGDHILIYATGGVVVANYSSSFNHVQTNGLVSAGAPQ